MCVAGLVFTDDRPFRVCIFQAHPDAAAAKSRATAALVVSVLAALLAVAVTAKVFVLGGGRHGTPSPAAPCGRAGDAMEGNMPEYGGIKAEANGNGHGNGNGHAIELATV